MIFSYSKLDLNEYKKLFVYERISDGKYELLSNDKSSGDVYKVSGFGSLDSTFYEHGFLYLKKGSSILEHVHTNDIEIYQFISGDNKISDNVCLLGNKHKIDCVSCDTIVETFKLNKNIINMDLDINILNYCLKIQALRYLWRINELLLKFAYCPDDLYYSSFDELSYYYQISLDDIKSMYKIYFYKNDYLPYIQQPVNLGNISFEASEIPYVVENAWQYELVKFNPTFVNNFECNYYGNKTRQNKSLIKTRNNISD